MKNEFDILMEQAAQHQFTKPCSVGDWSFEPGSTGTFAVVHNGEAVVTSEHGQIIDVKWGRRIADIEVHHILSSLIEHIPNVQLDIMAIRTEDCLDVMGYHGPSSRIADIPGLEDIDYYRAWVTTKENPLDPEKTDYVVYWDQGNTWCEVLASFEGVTHGEFVAKLHSKYQEWIHEDPSYVEDSGKLPALPDSTSLDSIISAAEKSCNNRSSSIEPPYRHPTVSSSEMFIDDLDCPRKHYNGNHPNRPHNLSYVETVKYVVDHIENKQDFYIDFTQSGKQARLHFYMNSIAGTNWYNVASEFFNGSKFVTDITCSDKDLKDFKHAVGVCWHNIQNALGQDFSSRIQAASERAAKANDTEKQNTAFQSMRTPHR